MRVKSFLGTVLLSLILTLHVSGQSAGGNLPANQSNVNQVYGAFWEVGKGENTTLLLRNAGPANPTGVTAKIILFSQDGHEEQMTQLNLKGNSVSRLSLGNLVQMNDQQTHRGGLAIQATGPVQGQLLIADAQSGSVRYLPLGNGDSLDTENTLHASWWLPDAASRGMITLFNSSAQAIVVTPSVMTGTESVEQPGASIALGPHASAEVDLTQSLLAKNIATPTMGSLILRYTGPVHALQPGLSISNQETGFLLQPQFQARHSAGSAGQVAIWQFPAISLTNPSRAGESMTGYVLFSNTTKSSLQPGLSAYFGSSSGQGSSNASLPVAVLQPGETRLINLSQLVSQGGGPAKLTHLALTVIHAGTPGDLGVTVWTANQSMSLVQMAFGAPLPSGSIDIGYWDVSERPFILPIMANPDEGPGSSPAQATLYFADAWGLGTYDLPQMDVAGKHGRVLGLRSALLSGIPDVNGNTIPSSARFGLVTVRLSQTGSHARNVSSSTAGNSQDLASLPSLPSLSLQSATTNSNPASLVLASLPHGRAAFCQAPPPPPACPSTITLSSQVVTYQFPNANAPAQRTFPFLHTGIGNVVFPVVGPGTAWSGTKIFESIDDSQTTTDCKAPIPTKCTPMKTPFTVGEQPQGTRFGTAFSLPPGNSTNSFFDEHTFISQDDVLTLSGQSATGCTLTCLQSYSCNGNVLGKFTIQRQFQHSTINGVSVTRVNVTVSPAN